MPTLYEYYNTGDDGNYAVSQVAWAAQTFTPATAHKITSVKLLLYRIGSPGTITVSIRATDGSGHPTGDDLCSGTTNGNTLPTGSPYEWREITLGDGYDLSASTKYAIVIRAPDAPQFNMVWWRQDISSPTYEGGNRETSGNSGSTWTSYTSVDFMFEEWGEGAAVTPKTSSDTGSGAEASTQTATLTKAETGTGVEGLLARTLGLTETGAGLDVVAQAQAILGGAEIGSGADAYVSLEKTEAKTSSDSGSGTEASTQTATLTKAETGTGVEGLLARTLGLTETGAGLDVVAQAQAILGGAEVGSGADAYVSLEKTGVKTSSDAGSGVEGTPVPTAILTGSETGSSIDAIIARLLASFDAGYGVEAGDVEVEGLLKELFATELGQGIDALVVKRGIFAGGEGTKFFGGGHEPPHRAS